MTFFVRCDKCGNEQESQININGNPINPINPETSERWYVRTVNGKIEHACSRFCLKGGLVFPI